MEQIIHRFGLDAGKTGVQKILHGFKINDSMSRRLEISLMNSGVPYEINPDVVAYLHRIKNGAISDTPTAEECHIEGNVIVYDVPKIGEEGLYRCQVKLVDPSVTGASAVLVYPMFEIEVIDDGIDDRGIQNTLPFSALENALAQASAFYDSRLLRIDVDDNGCFHAYYADGTEYKSDGMVHALEQASMFASSANGYANQAASSASDAQSQVLMAVEVANMASQQANRAKGYADEAHDDLNASAEVLMQCNSTLALCDNSKNQAKSSADEAKEYMKQAFNTTPAGYEQFFNRTTAKLNEIGLLTNLYFSKNVSMNDKVSIKEEFANLGVNRGLALLVLQTGSANAECGSVYMVYYNVANDACFITAIKEGTSGRAPRFETGFMLSLLSDTTKRYAHGSVMLLFEI